jgi:hypothetical protein
MVLISILSRLFHALGKDVRGKRPVVASLAYGTIKSFILRFLSISINNQKHMHIAYGSIMIGI